MIIAKEDIDIIKEMDEVNVEALPLNLKTIYKETSVELRETMLILFQLLPYLNKANIFMKPIQDNGETRYRPLDVDDIEKICINSIKAKKLKNNLLKLKIRGHNAIAMITVGKKRHIVLNPAIYKSSCNTVNFDYLETVFN